MVNLRLIVKKKSHQYHQKPQLESYNFDTETTYLCKNATGQREEKKITEFYDTTKNQNYLFPSIPITTIPTNNIVFEQKYKRQKYAIKDRRPTNKSK